MIDWNKPVRTKGGAETLSEAMVGYIISLESLLAKHVIDRARDGFSVENIPEAVAPVEMQEAFDDGYRAGVMKGIDMMSRNDVVYNLMDINKAWDESKAKSLSIGKRVV